ncbi:hypothetical protein SLEP1_g19106 [Rubroshorea leprosula]|nr:hypothetical protein SLEP1_g19106 [Rubroshorea leprosula]
MQFSFYSDSQIWVFPLFNFLIDKKKFYDFFVVLVFFHGDVVRVLSDRISSVLNC